MTDARPTEAFPTPAVPRPAPRKRRGRRVMLWVLIPVVLVIVLLVVADVVARGYAERTIASAVEKSLPNEVTGDVTVHVGGVSVIQQYLSGRFDSVTLDAPHLTVKGAPVSASVVATGVPVDTSKPVDAVSGTLGVSQSALNALITIPGATGDLTLGNGVLGYDGRIDLLGLPVGYTVQAKPQAAGSTVLLQPVKADLATGKGNVDLSLLLSALTAKGPFPVCAAQYLPQGVGVSDITVVPGHATVRLSAKDFVLDQASLSSKGKC